MLLGGVFLVVMVIGAVATGSVSVPIGDAALSIGHNITYRSAEFIGRLGFDSMPYLSTTAEPVNDMIVWQLRVPRTLAAIVVGGSLGLAGAVLQAMVRNPLADPFILGVSSGASFAAVLAMASSSALWLRSFGVPSAAFIGAIVTLGVVLLFAQRGGALTGSRIVLAGVGVGQIAAAGTALVQLHAEPAEVRGMLFWLMGSVAGTDHLGALTIPIAVALICLVLLLGQSRSLNALSMGDDDAIALGVDVHRFRIQLIVIVAVLTGSAVSVAGGVGFVGLMVPHVARFLIGADYRRLLPVAALLGAGFLVLVDTLARSIDPPNEYPLTIFTAVFGGPFFLWLLRRSRTGGAV